MALREDEPVEMPATVTAARLTATEVSLFTEGKLEMAIVIQPQRRPTLPPPKPPRRILCPPIVPPIAENDGSSGPAPTPDPTTAASVTLGHQRCLSSPPLSPKSNNSNMVTTAEDPPLSPKGIPEAGAWRLGGGGRTASNAARSLTSPRARVITTKTVVAIPIPRSCPLCKNNGGALADIRMIGYWATRGETVYMCLKTRSGELHATSPTDVCGYTWTSYVKMPMCFTCNVLMFVESRIHQWVFVCKECRREAQKPDNDNPVDDEDSANSA